MSQNIMIIWHQGITDRSFKPNNLRGGAAIDRTWWSSTSHRCSVGLRTGEFGGQGNTLTSSLCFGLIGPVNLARFVPPRTTVGRFSLLLTRSNPQDLPFLRHWPSRLVRTIWPLSKSLMSLFLLHPHWLQGLFFH